MRNHGLLASLAVLALLALSAGAALAAPDAPAGKRADDGRRAEASRDARNSTGGGDDAGDARDHRANGTARAEAAKARHAELKAAREHALASFKENRTAALADYHAALNATKASFMENKTRVQEECRAERNATANDSAGNRSSHGKCVRDGLKPLIEKARAEHRAAHDALVERLQDARKASMEGFHAAKARADARRNG